MVESKSPIRKFWKMRIIVGAIITICMIGIIALVLFLTGTEKKEKTDGYDVLRQLYTIQSENMVRQKQLKNYISGHCGENINLYDELKCIDMSFELASTVEKNKVLFEKIQAQ